MSIVKTLLGASVVCLVFYIFRMRQLGEIVFFYLPWNLFLAWIPLVITFGLVAWLNRHAWSGWLAIFMTLAWLLFLPNSFYMISDYIHLQEIAGPDILFDAVMFTLFVMTGMLLGYASLYVIHLELLKRISKQSAVRVVTLILFACSFAIYIGRDLRWNSWDVLIRPSGLLFDLSNQVIHPVSIGSMLGTVLIFFTLIGGLYYVGWQILQLSSSK